MNYSCPSLVEARLCLDALSGLDIREGNRIKKRNLIAIVMCVDVISKALQALKGRCNKARGKTP